MNLSHPNDVEKLDELIQQIYALLESRDSSEEALRDFLKKQSIQNFNSEVLVEKSFETAKLMMNWYVPVPAIWTDFGRVRIQKSQSRFFEQDYFVYQSDMVNLYIPYDYASLNEISIDFYKIDLAEAEKAQLIDAITELIHPAKLTLFKSND